MIEGAAREAIEARLAEAEKKLEGLLKDQAEEEEAVRVVWEITRSRSYHLKREIEQTQRAVKECYVGLHGHPMEDAEDD